MNQNDGTRFILDLGDLKIEGSLDGMKCFQLISLTKKGSILFRSPFVRTYMRRYFYIRQHFLRVQDVLATVVIGERVIMVIGTTGITGVGKIMV